MFITDLMQDFAFFLKKIQDFAFLLWEMQFVRRMQVTTAVDDLFSGVSINTHDQDGKN